jgi:hypothetical protein
MRVILTGAARCHLTYGGPHTADVPRRRVRTAVFSPILADEALPPLQVVGSILSVMKDADDRDQNAKVEYS